VTNPPTPQEAADATTGPATDRLDAEHQEGTEDLRHAIETASLAATLALVTQRIANIEGRLAQPPVANSSSRSEILEFAKVVLGGWPAFGLIFMLLFYEPVRDAINAIPEKVRSAEEIGLLGVSLKSTILAEAKKAGAFQLSETLPSLSPAAIEFLLRGSREYNSLVAFNKDAGLLTEVWIPSTPTVEILDELESKKLISIQVGQDGKLEGANALRRDLSDFKNRHPSKEQDSLEKDRVHLRFLSPSPVEQPSYSWRLTELGRNAVDIILKAVSTQLSPTLEKRKLPTS
jgi:hypothetical protein